MTTVDGKRPFCILPLLLILASFANAQEITFENLDFDVMHNCELAKPDLVERVVLIHLWGTT